MKFGARSALLHSKFAQAKHARDPVVRILWHACEGTSGGHTTSREHEHRAYQCRCRGSCRQRAAVQVPGISWGVERGQHQSCWMKFADD
jgi:hypothetical protein